jgi:hypothetical protein
MNVGGSDTWSDITSFLCNQYEPDKEYIGPLKYYPETGFPLVYFPMMKDTNYRAPLVMVQFKQPHPGIVIQVV